MRLTRGFRFFFSLFLCIALMGSGFLTWPETAKASTAKSTHTINTSKTRKKSGSVTYNVYYHDPITDKTTLLGAQKLAIQSDGNSAEDLNNSNKVKTKWTGSLSHVSGTDFFTLTSKKATTTPTNTGKYQYVTFNCDFAIPSYYIFEKAEKDSYGECPMADGGDLTARMRMINTDNLDGNVFEWEASASSQILHTGFSTNLCQFGIIPQRDLPDGKSHWTDNVSLNIYLTKPVGTATFQGNGGTPATKTVKGVAGDTIKAPTITRAGYQLTGWTPALGKYTAGNSTYKANWKEIAVESLSVSDKKIVQQVGTTKRLSVKINPSNAHNKKLTYQSSRPNIISVNKEGVLTFLKSGEATISAISGNGKKATVVATAKEGGVDYAKKGEVGGKITLKVSSMGLASAKIKATTTYKHTKYRVYIKPKNGKYKKIKSGKKLKSFKAGKLKENKMYVAKVQVKSGKKWRTKTIAFTTGQVQNLKATVKKKSKVSLKWQKITKATGYEVQRKAGKGKWKTIKTIKKNKNTYADSSVKAGTKYTYRIRAWKTSKTRGAKVKYKYSKSDSAKIKKKTTSKKKKESKKKKTQAQKNRAYIKRDLAKNKSKSIWKYVITERRSANKSSIYISKTKGIDVAGAYYSPVKYKFTGNSLEIHIYVNFLQYERVGKNKFKRKKADKVMFSEGENYKELYIAGLYHHYHGKTIKGSKKDFAPGFKVKTKLFVHDKSTRRYYATSTKSKRDSGLNKKQRYMPICLGGECPWCQSRRQDYSHWYHHDPNGLKVKKNKKVGIITGVGEHYSHKDIAFTYMPTYEEADSDGYVAKDVVHSIAGHEMGHALGLLDAYKRDGVDRMTNNEETCTIEKNLEEETDPYQNMMYQNKKSQKEEYLLSNDLEMMLTAYTISKGAPWNKKYIQAYKRHRSANEDFLYKISKAIKNHTDHWPRKKK